MESVQNQSKKNEFRNVGNEYMTIILDGKRTLEEAKFRIKTLKMLEAKQKIREAKQQELIDHQYIGELYCESILKPLHPIKNSDNMSFLKGVVNLECSQRDNIIRTDVVIRNITEPFWKACLSKVDGTNPSRVCAIGTPGIGKTLSTAYLIRMLLMRKEATVVYCLPKRNSKGYCYEFTVGTDLLISPQVTVYPELNFEEEIPSLQKPTTYFIVDPCQTDTSCDPGYFIEAKVIVVSAPNSKHWGGSEFKKRRGPNTGGLFLYMPVWSFNELESARPVMSNFSKDELLNRYFEVGGVPDQLFESDNKRYIFHLEEANRALNGLSPDQIEKVAGCRLDAVCTLNENESKSLILAIENKYQLGFATHKSILISESLREKFWKIHENQMKIS